MAGQQRQDHHWVIGSLGLALGILSAAPSRAVADVSAPPTNLSLQQTARVTAARFDFIIEGEVVGVRVVRHASGAGCICLTELDLTNLREIKGAVDDESLLITTLAMPEEVPSPDGCSHAIYYDTQPPRIGQAGIFLLNLHPEYGLFLQTVEYGFLPRQTNGQVTITLHGAKTWEYEAFRSELQNQATLLTLGSMSDRADVIVLAELLNSARPELSVEEGIEWMMYPFAPITTYKRDRDNDGPRVLRFSQSDNQVPGDLEEGVTRGILGRLMSHRLSAARRAMASQPRALIFGILDGPGVVRPLPNGVLALNDATHALTGFVEVKESTPAFGMAPLSALEGSPEP